MTTIDRTKYALVSVSPALTASGVDEIVATAQLKEDLQVFAKNVKGRNWRKSYKIVPASELSQPIIRR